MKLHFSNDWARAKIARDPDADPEVGDYIEDIHAGEDAQPQAARMATVGERTGVQLRIGMGLLVRQLRCKSGLSIDQVAQDAHVSIEDLRRVERDPHFTASPRLIFQLSEYFSVPLTMLSQLAGATHDVDRTIFNEAVKFAAHSDDVSTLTQNERTALDAFVALLNARAKA
jgi:HTH-type transcriptional regulator, competence development regulator